MIQISKVRFREHGKPGPGAPGERHGQPAGRQRESSQSPRAAVTARLGAEHTEGQKESRRAEPSGGIRQQRRETEACDLPALQTLRWTGGKSSRRPEHPPGQEDCKADDDSGTDNHKHSFIHDYCGTNDDGDISGACF